MAGQGPWGRLVPDHRDKRIVARAPGLFQGDSRAPSTEASCLVWIVGALLSPVSLHPPLWPRPWPRPLLGQRLQERSL